MRRLVRKRSEKAGLPPGSLLHIGEQKTEEVRVTVINYDENNYQEIHCKNIEETYPFKEKNNISWINIDGLHDILPIEKLGKHYGLHPLLLEDILNTSQRPKIEDYGDYIFIVLKMLSYEEKNGIGSEQVSLVLGSNFVLSFQENVGDVFDSLRERIKSNKGPVRKSGPDYLIYSLMDAIVDNYFSILEKEGEKIEEIEDQLTEDPGPFTLSLIRDLKSEMILLRRAIWPLREVVSGLERSESRLIYKSIRVYLRDIYDHTIQIMDTIESYRDTAASMIDIYLSGMSNKMNEIMKVLTIFATIFIPLTFLAGLWGMNFRYMPEIGWHWGYFAALGIMAIVALILIMYFRKKRWF